jgi:hypothetical protein
MTPAMGHVTRREHARAHNKARDPISVGAAAATPTEDPQNAYFFTLGDPRGPKASSLKMSDAFAFACESSFL